MLLFMAAAFTGYISPVILMCYIFNPELFVTTQTFWGIPFFSFYQLLWLHKFSATTFPLPVLSEHSEMAYCQTGATSDCGTRKREIALRAGHMALSHTRHPLEKCDLLKLRYFLNAYPERLFPGLQSDGAFTLSRSAPIRSFCIIPRCSLQHRLTTEPNWTSSTCSWQTTCSWTKCRHHNCLHHHTRRAQTDRAYF